jgi:SAM-dependent methyltransferase
VSTNAEKMSGLQGLRRWVRRHERLRRAAGRLAGKISQLRTRGLSVRERWARAISYESNFWDDWLATRAFGNEEEYRARLDRELPVQDPVLAEQLAALPQDEISILDVGAGPLTTLGRTLPDKRLEITAIDPLADEYDKILAGAGVDPPVRTQRGEGEKLFDRFEPGSFDVAFSANALDHSYDPLLVIANMVEVVRPGGFVLLRHRRNEAESKDYLGLHQWNFDLRDGRFVVWNRETSHDVAETLSGRAEVDARLERGEVCCLLRKVG